MSNAGDTGAEGAVATGADIAEVGTDTGIAEGSFQFEDRTQSQDQKSDFEKFVPEAYRDKEWVQNIAKSEDPRGNVFKKIEELEKLVGSGRQAGLTIPNEKSTPEEWKQYREAIGVPQEPNQYEFTPIAWDKPDEEAGKFIESQRDPKFVEKILKGMHDIGVPKDMAAKLFELHDKAVLETYRDEMQAGADRSRQLDADFDSYMTRMHGPNKEMVFNSGRKLLHESVSPATLTFINELGDTPEGTKALAVLADAMYGFHKKYVGEDSINAGNSTGSYGVGGMKQGESEIDALSQRARELMSNPAYKNPRDPDNIRLRKEVDEIYARQKELFAKKGQHDNIPIETCVGDCRARAASDYDGKPVSASGISRDCAIHLGLDVYFGENRIW